MKRLLLATAALTLIAAPAAATNLINQDSEEYKIEVSSGSGTVKTTINGKTTKGVCSSSASSCKIKVEGVGEIEVDGGTDVIIKNGELKED